MSDSKAVAAQHKAAGNAAFTAGQFDRAIDEFTKAIEADPTDHIFYSNRSGAYASKKDYDNALADADKCIELKPDFTKGYGRKGTALYGMEQYDEAVDAYKTGLEKDPNNKSLQDGLAEVERIKQRRNSGGPPGGNPMAKMFGPDMFTKLAADPTTARLLATDPGFRAKMQKLQSNPNDMNMMLSDPQVMSALGVLLGIGGNSFKTVDPNNPGDMADAMEMEQKEEEEERERSKAEAKRRAEEQQRKAAEEEAERQRQAAEQMSPEEKEQLQRKQQAVQEKEQGNTFYKQRQFDQALQHYNKAVELDPNNITYLNNIAAVQYEQKDYDAVVATTQKAIDISRESSTAGDYKAKARAYERMGNAYNQQQKYTEAIDAYERSLLEENNEKIRTTLKRITQLKKQKDEESYINPELSEKHKSAGNELYKQQNWKEAIAEYTEAIKRDPTNSRAYSNRANAYAKLMDFSRALEDSDMALKYDSKFVKPYIRKGNIYHFMKQHHKALECWDKGLALEPDNAELLDGRRKSMMAVNSGDVDEASSARAAQDPEIQKILRDPTMNRVLADLQSDPTSAQRFMQDPAISKNLEKLIAAGIIRTK